MKAKLTEELFTVLYKVAVDWSGWQFFYPIRDNLARRIEYET